MSDEKDRALERAVEEGDESAREKLAVATARRGERYLVGIEVTRPRPDGFEPGSFVRGTDAPDEPAWVKTVGSLDEAVLCVPPGPGFVVHDVVLKRTFRVLTFGSLAVRKGEPRQRGEAPPDRLALSSAEALLVRMAQEQRQLHIERHRDAIEAGNRAMREIQESESVVVQAIRGVYAARGLALPNGEVRIETTREGSVELVSGAAIRTIPRTLDAATVPAEAPTEEAPVETTIAWPSNGLTLPQTRIRVTSTKGFPSLGYILVTTDMGEQRVGYTSCGPQVFEGCTGGRGVMSTGNRVVRIVPERVEAEEVMARED